MSRKNEEEESEGNHERWLLTYSDMITLLLVLFIVMYTMSTVNTKKFEELARNLGGVFNVEKPDTQTEQDSKGASSSGFVTQALITMPAPVVTAAQSDAFEQTYQQLLQTIKDMGYEDFIKAEKTDEYILLRFTESVLFQPDSPQMKEEGHTVLGFVSETLRKMNDNIEHIQIDGHTANVGDESTDNYFAWELSSERAIEVLKILVKDGMQQSKMSVSGYSHYIPVSNNDTEEGRKQNRRVEIKITRLQDYKSIDAIKP